MIIGIDVSKDKLDLHLSDTGRHEVIKNTRASIMTFFEGERMTALPPISLVVFEATGGYEKWLHSYLIERGLPYHEAHPLRVRRFAQGKGYFAKTDKLDACILSQYGAQEERQADQGMSQQQLKLREYAARRAQLKALLATERQRLKSVYLEPRIARSIQRIIKQLARELAQVTQYLAQAIQQDETLQRKQALLKTAKGVGEEVSLLCLTNLPELGQLSREKIACLVGVAPQTKDSGRRRGYRSVNHGRFTVRKALYMAALVAARHDPRMRAFYHRLLAKGKAKKVALVAVMRKMLIMLNAMLKNNTPWEGEKS